MINSNNTMAAAVKNWASDKQCISGVYFFGSRIRGDHRPDSDLDVAVTLNKVDADSAFSDFIFNRDTWHTELSKLLAPLTIDLQWHHQIATPTVSAGLEHGNLKVFP